MEKMKHIKGYLILLIIANLAAGIALTWIGVHWGIYKGIPLAGIYFWILAAAYLVSGGYLIAYLIRRNYIERDAIYENYRDEVEQEKHRLRTEWDKNNDTFSHFIYICSPCRGDIKVYLDNAFEYCKIVYNYGHTPIAPHLYIPGFLDDNKPEEREVGMRMRLHQLSHCKELWVFGIDNPSEATDEMKQEIAFARANKIRVYYMYLDKGDK